MENYFNGVDKLRTHHKQKLPKNWADIFCELVFISTERQQQQKRWKITIVAFYRTKIKTPLYICRERICVCQLWHDLHFRCGRKSENIQMRGIFISDVSVFHFFSRSIFRGIQINGISGLGRICGKNVLSEWWSH